MGHNWTEKKVYPTKTAKGCYKKWCKRCKKVVKNTKYDVLKFTCSKSTDPAVYTNGTVMFDAAGALNAKYQQCGRKVTTISAVKGKVIGTLKMSSNYNIIVESNASFVRFVNLKKNGSIVNQQGRITLGTDSKEFLYYCDKMPTSVTSRNAVITIKDQFGRKLKVINVKQVNEKNGVVRVIKTQNCESKRTKVTMKLVDEIYRYKGKEYTVRIVKCSPKGSGTASALYQSQDFTYMVKADVVGGADAILKATVSTVADGLIPGSGLVLDAVDLIGNISSKADKEVITKNYEAKAWGDCSENAEYIYVKCGNEYKLGAIYSLARYVLQAQSTTIITDPDDEAIAFVDPELVKVVEVKRSLNWGNIELGLEYVAKGAVYDEHSLYYDYNIEDQSGRVTKFRFDSNIYSDYRDYL